MLFNVGGAAFKPPVLNPNYPANVSVVQSANASATFSIQISEAGEPAEYTYQWYVNNSPVSGATSASYTKSNLSSVGTYIIYCTVTHPAGVVTSRSATLSVLSTTPGFTYSGSYEIIEDSNGDWRIKLKTSGVLNFSNLGKGNGVVDIFCVGGGVGGKGYGGGGGRTTTTKGKTLRTNTNYTVTIGGGGSAGGGVGGTSSLKQGSTTLASAGSGSGMNGGSGGGNSAAAGKCGSGGSDGGDGGACYVYTYDENQGWYWYPYPGGSGLDTTTREFGESSGALYAGGGGGGANKDNQYNTAGWGGSGGGGNGSWVNIGTIKQPTPGGTNTGGGGGGAGDGYSNQAGGSGIVIIRNKR